MVQTHRRRGGGGGYNPPRPNQAPAQAREAPASHVEQV